MGESERTGLCQGTLFDSGGATNDYSSNENYSFTVCPNEDFQCLEIEVINYFTEADYDFLSIHAGSNIEGELLATINGQGFQTLTNIQNDCFTVHFTSDGSQQRTGFELKWQCSSMACPAIEETTCDNPFLINQIPFQSGNLTTCFAGNNLEIGACGVDNFLQGKDYILAYDSPGEECVSINLTGIVPSTGISIFRGCLESGEAFCINQKKNDEVGNSLSINTVSLKEAGRYFFVVAHKINCTPFNLEILPADNCPKVFPSAAACNKGLILNGCNPNLPTALSVEPASGDPDFFQLGINNGCWENVFFTNYTWFTFEAQGDGAFAFLLSNNDPNDVVDIDFNIWGPFADLEDACFGADNTQPIRSSWADDSENSTTGLTGIHPAFGTPITETCEGINGVGFLKPLEVTKGEVYVVLINDFDGVIFSGAISIDFSGSDANVLSNVDSSATSFQDTLICSGESIQLNSPKASIYDWSPSASLSCSACPNPIASPTESTTYNLQSSTVCKTTNSVISVDVISFEETSIVNFANNELFFGELLDSIVLQSDLENIATIEWWENGVLIEAQNESVLRYVPLANQPVSPTNQIVEIEAKITTSNGCVFYTNKVNVVIKPPTIPNAFTPGRDGQNDYFNILIPNAQENIKVFRIYDRWGKIVYNNKDPEIGWNGHLNNTEDLLPAGVYVYFFQYLVDNKLETLKGNVTLIR